VASADNEEVFLCCFPHAGGGASAYSNWSRSFPAHIHVHAVEYPGREARYRDPIPEELADLVDELIDRLALCLRPPFAFFGHSFGALVATELAKSLWRQERDLPLRLFIAGARAPHLAPRPAIGHLPDSEFIAKLCEFNGMQSDVLGDAQLMALVLPIIRADFKLLETYRGDIEEPLPVPISVFGGLGDRTTTPADILAWSALTRKAFRSRFLAGDHFFPLAERTKLAAHIIEDLGATGQGTCPEAIGAARALP